MNDLRVSGYKVENIIGEGGMGTVYKATHETLGRSVALKVLHSHLARDPDIMSRFKSEAKFMASLQHPNLVQLYDFREENGQLVLIMEYVDGKSLNHLIGKEVGPIPYEKALPLFIQMLDGVEEAHRLKILHRDIKPANIMVTHENIVKVTDFGIAKIAGEKGLTKTGTRVGTLFYMSPEQIKGGEIDQRSDLYSLGVTFYEMLSGHIPYDRGTTDFMIMNAILNENLPDPRERYPHIPDWVVKAMFKSVEKEKSKRFSSCSEFKQYLNSEFSVSNYTPEPFLPPAIPANAVKFCTHCGAGFIDDSIFCTGCGQPRD